MLLFCAGPNLLGAMLLMIHQLQYAVPRVWWKRKQELQQKSDLPRSKRCDVEVCKLLQIALALIRMRSVRLSLCLFQDSGLQAWQ